MRKLIKLAVLGLFMAPAISLSAVDYSSAVKSDKSGVFLVAENDEAELQPADSKGGEMKEGAEESAAEEASEEKKESKLGFFIGVFIMVAFMIFIMAKTKKIEKD